MSLRGDWLYSDGATVLFSGVAFAAFVVVAFEVVALFGVGAVMRRVPLIIPVRKEKKMRKRFGRLGSYVGALLVAVAIFGSPSPARADFPYGAVESSFLNLLPDTCIPVGTSGYCITFTNATYSSMLGMLQGQDQMGAMLSQQMTQSNINTFSQQFGINDATGNIAAGLMFNAATSGNVSQNTMAYAAANAITANTQAQKADIQAWANGISGQNGQLAATQAAAQVSIAQLNEQQQLLQFEAFEAQQDQQNTQNALTVSGEMLDLDDGANPSSGFIL